MSIATLTDPITPAGGKVTLSDYEAWTQGRTLYGGAAALIAYTAATRAFDGLPPLRAAQMTFVAPSGPEIELRREIIRRGRNVTQVRSEIWNADGCALAAIFLFGAEREANAHHAAKSLEPWPGSPDANEAVSTEKGPRFLKEQVELRRAQEARGAGPPVVRRWARLKEHSVLDPVSQLLLVGDVLPPGAMRSMQRLGPISSINWAFNVLEPAPATDEGWWLLENASEHADHGYSSERLRLWNTRGELILNGLQSVAIFG